MAHERSGPEAQALKHGLIGGLLSGLVYSAVASLVGVLQGMPPEATIRVVAAAALGPSVLEAGRPLGPILAWGMGLHLGYTALTGCLFAWLVAAQGRLRWSGRATLGAAFVYTLALWLSHFYLLAPLVGWWWFPERSQFLTAFLEQVGVWGGSLGLYFGQPRVRAELAPLRVRLPG